MIVMVIMREILRLDDPRGKECVAVCGDYEPKVHETAYEYFVVFEDVDYVPKANGSFSGAAALVFV